MEKSGYDLSRSWFDYCFENPEKVKPNHTALYFFCVEHCNRLGWKEKFGLPTTMAKEAVGIRSYNTYIKTLNDLVEFDFIKIIEKSKNQYSSNIIALSNYNKSHGKALDKALIKHTTKQRESTRQSIDSIIKQLTKNKEQVTNKHVQALKIFIEEFEKENSGEKPKTFSFKKAMVGYGFREDLVDEWIKVRKVKRGVNTEKAFKKFISEIEKVDEDKNTLLETIAVHKQWCGFEASWLTASADIQKNEKLLTYDEVSDLVTDKKKPITFDDFDKKEIDGVMYWIPKKGF